MSSRLSRRLGVAFAAAALAAGAGGQAAHALTPPPTGGLIAASTSGIDRLVRLTDLANQRANQALNDEAAHADAMEQAKAHQRQMMDNLQRFMDAMRSQCPWGSCL